MRRKVGFFMHGLKTVALVGVLFLSGGPRIAAQECGSLQAATSDELASYLSGIVPDQDNAKCITFAIKRLADRHYEPRHRRPGGIIGLPVVAG
jgi:hypothetical protein